MEKAGVGQSWSLHSILRRLGKRCQNFGDANGGWILLAFPFPPRIPHKTLESNVLTPGMLNRNIFAPLPTWLSRWFGYRSSPPPKRPDYIIWLSSFIGAFCGIALIQAVFEQAQYFVRRKTPTIVASYVGSLSHLRYLSLTHANLQGASAVLIYGAIDAPLAQPRALFGGHFLGALTGVIITKLFQLLPTEQRFDELAWLAASLSCATAIVVMQITKTTHPPAGEYIFLVTVHRLIE